MRLVILTPFLFIVVALEQTFVSTSGPLEPPVQQRMVYGPTKAKETVRHGFGLPNLFDFERFKTTFHKSYGSALEEMVRFKYFLSRTYEVFISAVEYRYRRSSYYKAINDRADQSPSELGVSRNKLINSRAVPSAHQRASVQDAAPAPAPEFVSDEAFQAEPAELEAELRRIKEHTDDPRYAQLADELEKIERTSRRRRRRRDLHQNGGDSAEMRANFEVESAFTRSDHDETSSKPEQRHPAGNNPKYQQAELTNDVGRNYQQEAGYKVIKEIDVWRGVQRDYSQLPVKGKHSVRGVIGRLTDAFLSNTWFGVGSRQLQAGTEKESGEPRLEDVVWVDHRAAGCFNPVQSQKNCASCYAFSTMALLEWAHCNQTGELVKFSEQYLIDCGPKTDEWLSGCQGGDPVSTGQFVANFGLEPESHYPYLGREGTCPYHPAADRETMGYIRVDLSNVVKVGLEYAETYLKRLPMLVVVNARGDFQFYGGGVYDGRSCNDNADHAVVLVGHGREDDEEYWLLRNSYGPSWGESGYMKLNKNSDCLHPRRALIFRPAPGWDMKLDLRKNEKVQRTGEIAKADNHGLFWFF